MKLIIVFGPPAVGKMTVGVELAKLTGLKLFHNHMTIDLVTRFFDWGTPQFKLVSEIRRRIFEEVADSNLPGLIFTYVWALDQAEDKVFIDDLIRIFEEKNANVYFVELEADLETRLERNKSEFRLSEKPPKRDIEKSEKLLIEHQNKYKLNSDNDFFYNKNYTKINNSSIGAKLAAQHIVHCFDLNLIES